MVVPKIFSAGGEQLLATYTYVDIADGTGVVELYGCLEATSGAGVLTTDAYVALTKNTVASQAIESSVGTTGTWAKVWDEDFDMTAFNTPRTVKGTALVNFPFALVTSGSGSYQWRGLCLVRIRKWDGTTETEIGHASSQRLDKNAAGTRAEDVCMAIPLTETRFKDGDILRVTIEIWAERVGGSMSAGSFYIAHDPLNRDGVNFTAATNPTRMKFQIPFKINL